MLTSLSCQHIANVAPQNRFFIALTLFFLSSALIPKNEGIIANKDKDKDRHRVRQRHVVP